MICAAMALHYALARNIDAHKRWALRTFIVVSGVWFFRVGLMLWKERGLEATRRARAENARGTEGVSGIVGGERRSDSFYATRQPTG